MAISIRPGRKRMVTPLQYRELRDQQWGANNRYDAWINVPMNNAKLLPFGLYDQWVPAFAALFKHTGGDWAKFYSEVETLGKLPPLQRKAALRQWAGPLTTTLTP